MIRALLVDERLALQQLEKLLKEHSCIEIIGACMEPVQAIELARKHKPDVVFLDIHMPEMNGMRAAELIQQSCPGIEIVFVTAYDNYALEAFELNALDYVLKPIQRARLGKTVQRLEDRLNRNASSMPQAGDVWLRTLGMLGYSKGNGPIQGFKRRTAKAQELFAYFLHHRNRVINKDVMLEVLWPDFEPKKAVTHLYTTIYQVRQFLMQAGLDVQIQNVSGGEGYTLDLRQATVDVAEWENGVRRLGVVRPDNREEHQRLFDLYTGEYFGGYDYLWAEGERERVRTIWLHHTSQLARFYSAEGMIVDAVTTYKRLIELHPYYEEGYLGLMQLYDQMGDLPAVEACFSELQKKITDELNVKLSPKVLQWYHSRPYLVDIEAALPDRTVWRS